MNVFFSAVSVVSFNPCVYLHQELKYLFSFYQGLPKKNSSTPKIDTFLPNLPVGNEKVPLVSNPKYLY